MESIKAGQFPSFETTLDTAELAVDELVRRAIDTEQPFQTQELSMAIRAVLAQVRNTSNVAKKDTL